MPRAIETFVDNHGQIFLLSNDQNSLQNAGKAILQYVKNTHPSALNSEIVIQPFHSKQVRATNHHPFPDALLRLEEYLVLVDNDPDTARDRSYASDNILHNSRVYYTEAERILECDYRYALRLDLILPNAVKTTLDISHRYQRSGVTNRLNCHAGALIATGIFPTANYSEDYIMNEDIANGIHSVTLSELVPGDIITLGPYDHSMVYLADDLCISVNGRSQVMGIYTIKEVADKYVPSIQYQKLTDLLDIACCYRKDSSLQYSESIINMIKESYLLELSNYLAPSIHTVIMDKLNTLAQSLMIECWSTNVPTRWCNKFQMPTDDKNLYEAITNIRLVQKDYGISNIQAIAMLEKPGIWKNISAVLTERGRCAFKEGRITMDDVLEYEDVDQFAQRIQPSTYFSTFRQTFFAFSQNVKDTKKNQQNIKWPYFTGMLCIATAGLLMASQFYSMNNEEADISSQPKI